MRWISLFTTYPPHRHLEHKHWPIGKAPYGQRREHATDCPNAIAQLAAILLAANLGGCGRWSSLQLFTSGYRLLQRYFHPSGIIGGSGFGQITGDSA
jgi:hypothetical protein